MEVLTMLKFWKSSSNTTSKSASTTTTTASDGDSDIAIDSTVSDHLTEFSDDDDDDSYFELELTLPSHNSRNGEKEEKEPKSFKNSHSKPQSPISIIRAASPKLRVFMFGRLAAKKSSKLCDTRVEDFSETDTVSEISNYSPSRLSNDSFTNSSFTVKFKIEDGSIVPKFTRSRSSSNSTRLTSPKVESRNAADVYPETSKRFSKDKVQKYINLIKPKSSKKCCDSERLRSSSPSRFSRTPFSPLKEKVEKQSSIFKVKCKQLGKSKSASAMVGVVSPVRFSARTDHPADGIEGAILHCKRSFNGHASLSRCSSDPSHEKSIPLSEEI